MMLMAGLRGKSGPPGNQNAFRHELAGISQRRAQIGTAERILAEIETLQEIMDCPASSANPTEEPPWPIDFPLKLLA